MQPPGDEALIRRIGDGDRLAMQLLFARHHVRIYRFIVGLVRHSATAEDLTNDVFLDVWRQAGRFEGKSSVSTWLFGIARFKALSALRRRPEAELDDEAADTLEDPADTPGLAMEKQDKAAIMRACIAGLSVEHREVIDLIYYHEKSIEEVAAIVGIPPATVKTRMFYARKKLGEVLRARGVERGWP